MTLKELSKSDDTLERIETRTGNQPAQVNTTRKVAGLDTALVSQSGMQTQDCGSRSRRDWSEGGDAHSAHLLNQALLELPEFLWSTSAVPSAALTEEVKVGMSTPGLL